ncbi:MAG: NAD(P)H-hydrate dehydratase [Phycisphaerales bacterium]
MTEPAGPLPPFPARPLDGHKGTFGTVVVLGGQAAPPRVMVGGPALAALAALRSGAGLAMLAVPAPFAAAALTIAPSATALALPVDAAGRLLPSACAEVLDAHVPKSSCLALGPGLGDEPAQRQVVIRVVASDGVPLVVDADALNCLASTPDFQADFRAAAIVTPHPGEFARLAHALRLDAPALDARGGGAEARIAAAGALARRLGCICVLKGHGTVVSDGLRHWVCEAGNPALATAGTGDVLTGVTAALVAQFAPRSGAAAGSAALGLFDCARLAVQAHAHAADAWARRHGPSGMLASDLVAELPDTIAAMRGT